jgi:hypothetical protein
MDYEAVQVRFPAISDRSQSNRSKVIVYEDAGPVKSSRQAQGIKKHNIVSKIQLQIIVRDLIHLDIRKASIGKGSF